MATMTLNVFDALVRDMYPQPGERIKQWVVDMRREEAWDLETCPRVFVESHHDNTGTECRNAGATVPWTYLNHDCCGICGNLHDALGGTEAVLAWRAEKANRPPVEADRTKLSDQVQPDFGPSPASAFARGR